MTPPRAKPVLAWAVLTTDGEIIPGSVWLHYATARVVRREGERIVRVEIREIKEKRDDQ